MSFLIDANVIVYAASISPFRDACLEIITAVDDEAADGRVSTAILEEVWHLELTGRAAGIEGLARRTHSLFSPLLAVTDEIVARALDVRGTRRLGTNDRVHVATALVNGIDTIVSVDDAFDGVVGLRRVDPRNVEARSRLLRG